MASNDPSDAEKKEASIVDPSRVTIGRAVLPVVIHGRPQYLEESYRMFHAGPTDTLRVALKAHCLYDIVDHVGSTSLEAGGLLLGRVFAWDDCNYVQIEVSITSPQLRGSPIGLYFTLDGWKEMLTLKDALYSDLLVVGWYHSHPYMETYMSGWDITLHEAIFHEPWQLALVTDPYSGVLSIYQVVNSAPELVRSLALSGVDNVAKGNLTRILYREGQLLFPAQPQSSLDGTAETDGPLVGFDFLLGDLGKEDGENG
jgi:proteasome lid subunit RPN8/RPN11